MEVGLGPGDFVLDGDPLTCTLPKRHSLSPIFPPMSVVAKWSPLLLSTCSTCPQYLTAEAGPSRAENLSTYTKDFRTWIRVHRAADDEVADCWRTELSSIGVRTHLDGVRAVSVTAGVGRARRVRCRGRRIWVDTPSVGQTGRVDLVMMFSTRPGPRVGGARYRAAIFHRTAKFRTRGAERRKNRRRRPLTAYIIYGRVRCDDEMFVSGHGRRPFRAV